MEVFTLLTLAALVIKVTTVVKAIGKDNNMVFTQLVVWVVGTAVLFLASHSDISKGIVVFDGAKALGDLDAGSLILAGLALGSTGAFAYDVKKAVDGSDSATEPSLTSQ